MARHVVQSETPRSVAKS